MSITTPPMMPTTMTNSNQMIDQMKQMIMTMMMVKSTTSTSNTSGSTFETFFNTFLTMLLVSCIDSIAAQLKLFLSIISAKINAYINSKSQEVMPSIVTAAVNKLSTPVQKQKMSSILINIGTSEPKSAQLIPDAIMDLITNMPNTPCISLENGNYKLFYRGEISISKDVVIQLKNTSVGGDPNAATNNPQMTEKQLENLSNAPQNIIGGGNCIELFSYSLNMDDLRAEIDKITKDYLVKVTNKLGNQLFYFSELPYKVNRDSTGQIDYNKLPDRLNFSMMPFNTNRSFQNLFGKEVDIIRRRINFFRDNKKWYDEKGVPYTLGIMMSGPPGTGKTSMIKCISNELKRHIVNVHLTDAMTKSQMENLFYNEQLSITQNGKTEICSIPINRRLYVLEDIDCQCDVVLNRKKKSDMQKLVDENELLRERLQELKHQLENPISSTTGTRPAISVPPKRNIDNEKDSQRITLSFLLNLFDGVLETPGRIVLMTTNFIDKLDAAFRRPGRVDVIANLSYSEPKQIVDIVEHRYDSVLSDAQKTRIYQMKQCISAAEVGRILFENFDNLEGALNGLQEYSETESARLRAIEIEEAEAEALLRAKMQEAENERLRTIEMEKAEAELRYRTTMEALSEHDKNKRSDKDVNVSQSDTSRLETANVTTVATNACNAANVIETQNISKKNVGIENGTFVMRDAQHDMFPMMPNSNSPNSVAKINSETSFSIFSIDNLCSNQNFTSDGPMAANACDETPNGDLCEDMSCNNFSQIFSNV